MTPLADQLRALGLDGVSVIAELAELDGERFDPAKTLERLRMNLAFYERELEETVDHARLGGQLVDRANVQLFAVPNASADKTWRVVLAQYSAQ